MFYQQKRVGQHRKLFGIWKFATMLKDSPNLGTGSLTVRNDPRVTPIGKYLRATKINELPQLLNVVVGEMSFVGPRPQMLVDFDVYPHEVREVITNVPPGITGHRLDRVPRRGAPPLQARRRREGVLRRPRRPLQGRARALVPGPRLLLDGCAAHGPHRLGHRAPAFPCRVALVPHAPAAPRLARLTPHVANSGSQPPQLPYMGSKRVST